MLWRHFYSQSYMHMHMFTNLFNFAFRTFKYIERELPKVPPHIPVLVLVSLSLNSVVFTCGEFLDVFCYRFSLPSTIVLPASPLGFLHCLFLCTFAIANISIFANMFQNFLLNLTFLLPSFMEIPFPIFFSHLLWSSQPFLPFWGV